MAEATRTFDGGTPGNATVTGENDVEVVQVGSQSFVAGIHGNAAVQAGTAANTADTRFRVDLGVSGDHWGSVYLRNPTAHGSGSASVIFWRLASSGNAFIVEFRARPSNALSIRVSSVEVRSGSLNEIPVDQVFRLDWYIHGTTFDWKVYTTNPEALATDTADISGTLTPATQTPSRAIMGAESSSTIPKHWVFDTVRARDVGGWYDGYNLPPAGGAATVWNGSSEVAATVTLWNGTSEVSVSDVEVNP
jgi:hypothetical protein